MTRPTHAMTTVFGLWVALLVAFASGRNACAQTFVQVAPPDLAAHVAFSTGASWIDADGDGDLDLHVVTAFGADNHDVLYRNDGGDLFTAWSGALSQDDAQTVCGAWADVDNDGWLDAFVSGLELDQGKLYRGTGGGAFAAASGSGLEGVALRGTGCAWADYDNDGHVDLVVAVLDGVLGMSGGNRLFHNDGDGTFTEVSGDPVVTQPDTHHHPTWADFDGDGDVDLFFATGPVGSTAPDRMYRNQLVETGTAGFTPIVTGVLATDARDSQTLSWVDYDNDGDLDCYAINYTSVGNQLYRNDGGTFTKIVSGQIVTDTGAMHGVAWGDYDNDGDLDAFVVRDQQQTDRHYRNNGNGTFSRVNTGPHVTQALSGYGAAAGDYDNDGDLDLFVPTAREEGPSALFRNDLAPGNHWLELSCVGRPTNRSAIGAKVRVRAVIGGVPRWQMREIAAGTSYGGHNPHRVHFGLGDADLVDTLRIEWLDGVVDVHTGVPADTILDLGESVFAGVGNRGGRPVGEIAVQPNPFTGRARIRFRLERAGEARIEVYDLQGRRGAVLASGWHAAGWHTADLDATGAPSAGVLLVRVGTREGTLTRRVVRIR